MKTARNILHTICISACLALPTAQISAQESNAKGGNMMAAVHPLAKDAMDMKKAKKWQHCDDAESQRTDDGGRHAAKGDGDGDHHGDGDER